MRFRKVAKDYDPRNRKSVLSYLEEHQETGEVPTGLLFIDEDAVEMHQEMKTVETPKNRALRIIDHDPRTATGAPADHEIDAAAVGADRQ